nr:MAG: replication associated protein [Cressdnaviricota sp.]
MSESPKNGKDGNLGGNTKLQDLKREKPSKRWVFTLNNYTQKQMAKMASYFDSCAEGYIIGEEVGEEGTPHLQGYVEFKKIMRMSENKELDKKIHWEIAKGDKQTNYNYCSKDGKFVSTLKGIKKPVRDPLAPHLTNLKKWQVELFDILKGEPDCRKIYWYYDEKGGAGKSSVAKHLGLKGAFVCEGAKKTDIACAVKLFLDKGDFETAIFDFTRQTEGYVSYSTLEAVKNGGIFSAKYESGMLWFNVPHVIVFANFEPDVEMLSKDRWVIFKI